VIKRFWQVLEGLSSEDKIAYLRFVWGRTRLPLKDEEVVEQHTIQLDENASNERLPIGRTCFFRIELPPYPSTTVLKSKLLYSIIHCRAIDADFDRAGAPNEEENIIPAGEELPVEGESEGESEHRNVNLFGNNDYSSENDDYGGGGGGGYEEEE